MENLTEQYLRRTRISYLVSRMAYATVITMLI